MDTKRTLLAVALSMAVLLLYQYFYAPKPKPQQPKPATVAPAAPPTATPVPAAPSAPVSPGGAVAPTVPQPVVPAAVAALENDRLAVKLSSRGAAVVGASVKEYRDRPGEGGRPVQLLAGAGGTDFAGDARLAGGGLALQAPFREVQRGTGSVTYAWDSPAGLHVEKTYALAPGRYDLTLTVRIRNNSGQVLQDRLGLVSVQDYGAKEEGNTFLGPSYLNEDDLVEVKLKEIKKGPVSAAGTIPWAALLDEYFLVAMVPATPATGLRVDRRLGLERLVELELQSAPINLAPGAESASTYRVYLGPKLAAALAPVGSQLERVVDYGWFSIIARPLLAFLNMIYSVIGNYGIAIILLTTVVKAIFWPLSAKSFKSMQKMKDLQPKLQKLKERYGKDRERLNMEVMQLYKTHKVNPMGGCLPMLVQIPVFFALYRVLLGSIELRHAPFFLWIQDLSVKDPFYVTPLIMGVTMFLQQKMAPATGMDEMQQKMMLYGMPVVFTFMFLNFPSGLVLYWLVNNVLSIAQQYWMMKQSEQPA
jgi:YidC/Oxa1 family membrane protein insertase